MALSKSLEYPKGHKDHAGILRYTETVMQRGQGWRHRLEANAMSNILNYLGIQWFIYDETLRAHRPLGLKRNTPRPVTNKIGPLVNTTASRLVSFKPPITVRPGGLDADDVTAAGVGEDIARVIERETNIARYKSIIARWLLLTGNVWLISNYDVGPDSGADFISFEQCMECQAVLSPLQITQNNNTCPNCGGNQFIPAINPEDGMPLGEWQPRGRHYTEIENIFTARYDPEALDIYESPYFGIDKGVPMDWVIRTYGEKKAEKVSPEDYRDLNQYYLESLAFTVGAGRHVGGTYGHRAESRARLRRIWIRPRHDKAPGGIYAVICGNEVMESMPWSYHKKNGDPFLNAVHIKFDDLTGSLLGRSRVDDLVSKQYERNLVEAHLLLHTKRMSNALWLLPRGVGVQTLTGESGQYVHYNALQGVPPPTRIPGTSPPPFMLQWVQWIDEEMDAIWGSYEIDRGDAPKGVEAAAALTLLDERAQQAQANLQNNWAIGWMEWTRQNLDIWREYADMERTISVAGGQWAASKFSKADLIGGIDIDVDLGQNRPRTLTGLRASLAQAHQMALLNPADPQERFRALQLLGLPEIMQDYKLDYEQANRENDIALNSNVAVLTGEGMPQPVGPPFPWDNHMVHITVHRQFLVSEKFRMLHPNIQKEFIAHVNAHFTAIIPAKTTGEPKEKGEAGGVSEKDVSMDDAQREAPNSGGEITGE